MTATGDHRLELFAALLVERFGPCPAWHRPPRHADDTPTETARRRAAMDAELAGFDAETAA